MAPSPLPADDPAGRIAVGVCSASQVFLAGIAVWLAGQPDVDVVARTQRVADLDLAAEAAVVVVDGRLDDELETLLGADRTGREQAVVLLVDRHHTVSVPELVRAGIRGVLDPDCAEVELLGAVRAAADGHLYVQRELIDQLVALEPGHLTAQRSTPASESIRFDLTTREIEVWMLLATGLSNEKIADAMALSHRTVRFHAANLFRKIDVGSRSAAVALAYQTGTCS